jgi:hypothetical protein
MRGILRRLRHVLSMDADEAMDRVLLRYVGVFRRHLVLMHILSISASVVILVYLYIEAGGRFLVAWLIFSFAWVALFIVIGSVKGRRHRRRT